MLEKQRIEDEEEAKRNYPRLQKLKEQEEYSKKRKLLMKKYEDIKIIDTKLNAYKIREQQFEMEYNKSVIDNTLDVFMQREAEDLARRKEQREKEKKEK